MTTTTTTNAETKSWVIRPMTVDGKRRFRPVAIDSATGEERFGGYRDGFASVAATRSFIAKNYAAGTAFPSFAPIDPYAMSLSPAEIDRIREAHRYAGV